MNQLVTPLSPTATKWIRKDHAQFFTLFHRLEPGQWPETRAAIVRSLCNSLEMHAQVEEEIFYPALRECGIESPALARSVPEHDEMRRLIERLRSIESQNSRQRQQLRKGSGETHGAISDTKTSGEAGNLGGDITDDLGPLSAEHSGSGLGESAWEGAAAAVPVHVESAHSDDAVDEAIQALMKAVLHHVADEETQVLPMAERRLSQQRLVELGARMAARRLALARPHAGEMALDMARAAPGKTALVTVGALVAGSLLLGTLRRSRHHH